MPSLQDVMKMMGMVEKQQQPQPQLQPQQQPQPNLGSGMAQQALQIMQSRPYQLHVQEAKGQGMQPMSPEEFMKMQMQGQPAPKGLLS